MKKRMIWHVKKQAKGWGEPQQAGQDVNTLDLHWQTSVSVNRSLYFGTDQGMMRSRFVNGQHQKPEKVEEIMHPGYRGGTRYIGPDESYFIFSADDLPGGLGKRDLYIGYRRDDGTWTDPVHLGDPMNTPQHDLCPVVTYDGKYLLHLSWHEGKPGGVLVPRPIHRGIETQRIKVKELSHV